MFLRLVRLIGCGSDGGQARELVVEKQRRWAAERKAEGEEGYGQSRASPIVEMAALLAECVAHGTESNQCSRHRHND
eukprot:6347840-Pyramimonas_sp.AAC.1